MLGVAQQLKLDRHVKRREKKPLDDRRDTPSLAGHGKQSRVARNRSIFRNRPPGIEPQDGMPPTLILIGPGSV